MEDPDKKNATDNKLGKATDRQPAPVKLRSMHPEATYSQAQLEWHCPSQIKKRGKTIEKRLS